MQPFTRSIVELFDDKKRYLIPLYQRQYAWRVEPQLTLLWEDIERAVGRVGKDPKTAAPHFMGALVISEIKTFGREVPAYEVIDGQQRLTTFQLLLCALRDVAAAHDSDLKAELTGYLFNFGNMADETKERFKLWPSLIDRRAFAGVMDPRADLDRIAPRPRDEDGVVRPAVQAYNFFKDQIERHVAPGGAYDAARLARLVEALKTGLAVVSIELEGGDDPQVIFETLNSRGVDLTSSDLMRNFIFQRAKGMGQEAGSLKIDELYQRHWLPLDHWFWREGLTRGRQTKPRLEWLLTDHLSMKKAANVSADNLFEDYRRWILSERPFASVTEELESITASAVIGRRLFEQKPDDVLGRFARFAEAFDVSTAMPLVLYLATGGFPEKDLPEALTLIESLIVRRDICGLTTKNYNILFVDIIDKMRRVGDMSLVALKAVLSANRTDTRRWPDNEEWKVGWLEREQYKNNRQPRLRYLFEHIEKKKRSVLSEEIEIKSDLTVEHILPQKWQKNWPVPGFDHLEEGAVDREKLEAEGRRELVVNRLGNLTLLTQALNSTISNGPFSVKMPALLAHASLWLNRDLQKYDRWDEASVRQRSVYLFDIATAIWPAPVAADAPIVQMA